MKKLIYTLVSFLFLFSALFVSCTDDFFEKPESSEVTIDDIFSRRLYAEELLWYTYNQLVPRGFPIHVAGDVFLHRSILASISDEGDNIRGASGGKRINPIGFWPILAHQHHIEDCFVTPFRGIRHAYIFIENIDRVDAIPQSEREMMKAEAKVLVALRYQEMLKRYGGVPIVRQSFDVSDDLKIPRATFKETVDFIVELCDEAAAVLPNNYPDNWKGRITKGVALANKARTLLIAASPLYNASESVLAYPYPELICYGNFDNNRWKAAVDANLELLNWAQQNGYELINTNDPFNDYGNATCLEDNAEVILANKWTTTNNHFQEHIRPRIAGIRGLSIPFNIIHIWRKADGSNQVWDEQENVKVPFTQYTAKMNEMEPRFYQSVWPAGQSPRNNNVMPDRNWPFSNGNANGEIGGSGLRGVAVMVKFFHNYNNEPTKEFPVFRLAEIYLNFAEAANEFYGPTGTVPGTSLTALSALNIIRNRGGLPALSITQKDVLREEIKRERAVELFAEGFRNFDLRRWKEAEVMGGPFYGFRFDLNAARNNYDTYFLFHYENRFWAPNQYFYPFPQIEADKGYLVQNPGF
jgi:starch-binding outer membrane protein, SusD/RagB family